MFDTKVFLKLQDSLGHYIVSDVVVKHKVFEFRFRIEPEGYIPEPEFVPFLWRKGDDDADDDANGKQFEDAMDTSEASTATQGGGEVLVQVLDLPRLCRVLPRLHLPVRGCRRCLLSPLLMLIWLLHGDDNFRMLFLWIPLFAGRVLLRRLSFL